MKKYTVTINTESSAIVHTYKARSSFSAGIKAVCQFFHLGARFNNVTSVVEN